MSLVGVRAGETKTEMQSGLMAGACSACTPTRYVTGSYRLGWPVANLFVCTEYSLLVYTERSSVGACVATECRCGGKYIAPMVMAYGHTERGHEKNITLEKCNDKSGCHFRQQLTA